MKQDDWAMVEEGVVPVGEPVFCGQCRYLHGERCLHPATVEERQIWKGVTRYFPYAYEKNAQNDCQDFIHGRWWVEAREPVVSRVLMLLASLGWLLWFFLQE
jgi:hypothetical protein